LNYFRKSKGKKGRSEIRQLGLLGTIPILLAVGPLIGFFIGRWLDEKLGTGPFLLVLFLIFGFIASGREIYRLLKRAEDEEKKDRNEQGN
jgi:ATP synthase protein I